MYAEFIAGSRAVATSAANMVFLNVVFTLLVVVVAAFAVSTANRWASDEEEGRLELVLATPKPATPRDARALRRGRTRR